MNEDKKAAPVVIAWETGKYTLDAEGLLYLPAATLKKMLKYCTVDIEKTRAAIRALIEQRRKLYRGSSNAQDRREYARLGKLLDVLEPGKKTGTAERVAQRVIKRAPVGFAGIFESGGKACVCDGYMLLAFHDALPESLPKAEKSLNAGKLLDAGELDQKPLELPTLADVHSYMRLAKAAPRETWTGAVYPEKGRTLYDFGPGRPVVNLELLRDVLEALPGARAVWTGEKSPIVFDADNGRGLLLPVLPQGNAARTRPAPAETEPESTESTAQE